MPTITSLTQLLIDVDQLSPKERKNRLVIVALLAFKTDPKGFRDELDVKLAASEILPRDYGLILHASASIEWAVDVLKNCPYPPIVVTAIELFGKAWRKDPTATSHVLSDAYLVHLIDNDLPRYATMRLFRSLGTIPHLTSAHSITVDGILEAIFPFLTKDSPTPLSRYARSSIVNLFTSASSSVVMEIVKRCASWFDEGTWKRLAQRRPEVAEQILLLHAVSANVKDRNHNNSVMMWAILRDRKDTIFFARFMELYVVQILQDKEAPDVFGAARSGRVTSLIQFMTFILRKRTSEGLLFSTTLDFCAILRRLVDADACPKWSLDDVYPLLDIACHQFGKHPEEWSLDESYETTAPNATAILVAIFRNMEYSIHFFSNPSPSLSKLLHRLPMPARLPFLNILHVTKTGTSLVKPPSNPETYGTFSTSLLSILSPEHGRRVLEVGTTARKQEFLVCGRVSGSTRMYPFGTTSDVATRALFAIWAAAERSAFGRRDTEHGQADATSIQDLEEVKQRAIRSRDERLALVQQALHLSMLSRSPILFIDTLWWAVKRYAKDPETGSSIMTMFCNPDSFVVDFLSGPVGLFACQRTRGRLTTDMLHAWCSKTNEIADALMHLLSVWVHEPSYVNNMKTHYQSVESTLFNIIEGRCAFIDKVFPVLLDDLDAIRDICFLPLVDSWMKLERFKVEEHPTIFDFGIYHCSPCIMPYTLSVHLRILPAIFSFAERLGMERENLYREGRLKISIGSTTIDARKEQLRYSASRHIFPFEISVMGLHASNSCRRLILPSGMSAYVESIVLGSPSSMLDNQRDQLDWYPGQYLLALEAYLSYSKTRDEVDEKIKKLWRLYGPNGNQPDLRSAILRSSIVQEALWDRPKLNELVQPWFPEFPARDATQDIDFNPLSLLPSNISSLSGQRHSLLALREPEDTTVLALYAFLAPFFAVGDTIRGPSISGARRLAVFTVAWILTLLDVPRDVSLAGEITTGPVGYAIRKVRINQAFVEACKSTKYSSPYVSCYILNWLLPTLSLSEVDLLTQAVFAAPKTPTSDAMSVEFLGHVRTLGIPKLANEQAFHVLEDVEASSWHRQTVTARTINHCRPLEARDLMCRLVTYTQERYREQNERRKIAAATTAGSTEGQAPLLKLSTHKMVMQLLQVISPQGSVDVAFIEKWAADGLLETAPSIRSYAVDVLVDIVQDSFVIDRDGNETSSMWDVLSPFIDMAQRLNEDVVLTEEQWAAARTGQDRMPNIDEERHIASSLLSRSTYSMSSSLKIAWAKKVVMPVITGHVRTRTKWLRTAIAREGGSQELAESASAIYGSGMPVTSSFATFAPYLPTGDRSLLDILEREALGFLERDACQQLLDLMAKNHPKEWERDTYGRSVKTITAYATSDDAYAGYSARAAIYQILVKPDIPSSLIQDSSSSLRRIGLTLLQPENAFIHRNLKIVVPFSSFTRFVVDTLAPVSTNSLNPKVVALLSDFLASVEASERQSSEKSLNGGANYWRLIIILKLLSLRVVSDASHDSDWIQVRARELLALSELVVNGKWYHVHFPLTFGPYLRLSRVEDVIPVCLSLTQAPVCPAESGWLRTLCFDTAVMLLRAQQSEIASSAVATNQLQNLKTTWENDVDVAVRWLASSWTDQSV